MTETEKALREAEAKERETARDASISEDSAKSAHAVHEKWKAMADELRTKAEVEAFAYRFHAKLLAAMKRGSTNVVDMLGAAMEAAGVGGVAPSPSDLEAQEAAHAKRMCDYRKARGAMDMLRGSPAKIAEPPALSYSERLIADEHWKRGHDSGKKTGMDIAADRLGPLLWPTWESMYPLPDAEAVLNAVEIRLKAIRAPPDTIKAEARDEVRQRLLAAIFKHGAPPDISLDAAIEEAGNRVVCAGSALELVSDKARDAALEEAMNTIALLQYQRKMTHEQWDAGVRSAWDAVCALKSKPAPEKQETPEPCGASMGTINTRPIHCTEPKGHAGEHTHQLGFVPLVVKCLVPGGDRPHQHEGAHSETSAPVVTEETLRSLKEQRDTREDVGRRIDEHVTSDVHDFGWALAQMRAGHGARTPDEPGRTYWALDTYKTGVFFSLSAINSTRWEVVP